MCLQSYPARLCVVTASADTITKLGRLKATSVKTVTHCRQSLLFLFLIQIVMMFGSRPRVTNTLLSKASWQSLQLDLQAWVMLPPGLLAAWHLLRLIQ